LDDEESFTMPTESAGIPLSYELGQQKESNSLSIPLHVKVAEAVDSSYVC